MSAEKKKKKIKINVGKQADVSPYVIHLAYEKPATVRKETSPNLDALARSLLMDPEPSAAPTDDLSVNVQTLAHQLRESETQSTERPPVEEALISVVAEVEESPAPAVPVEPVEIALIREAILDTMSDHQEDIVEQVQETVVDSFAATQETLDEEEYFQENRRRRFRLRLPGLTFIGPRARAVAAFVFLAVAITLPLHAIQQVQATEDVQTDITGSGASAIEHFLRAAEALQGDRLDVAEVDFARASENFSQAQDSIRDLNMAIAAVANVIPTTDRTYESARGLITAGKELSIAATGLTNAAQDLTSRETLTATTKLSLLTTYVKEALPHAQTAAEALENVDETLVPAEYQSVVSDLKTRVPALADSMQEFIDFSQTLVTVMGGEQKMRYLVIFQNNTELRATGGFTGSFAEIDVLNGEVVAVNIPPGGTYDIQGQLSQFVSAPQPLTLLDPRWEFHDANWFPDFPTSAEKMLWFYEHAGGPTVDGVIAVNATMMPELLEITGPIEMPEYGRTIDSENFLFETQKIVEYEYEQFTNPDAERKEDAPKQFIGDLAPIVLEQLKSADMNTMLAMLDLVGQGLTQKDILLYFNDNELQSDIERLGWSGSLKNTAGDYLMVVDTNLGGGKTDLAIDQTVDMTSEIQKDGSIINTVTITKEHRGLQTALFEGVNNVDYVRLYVPKGSELISATGFEIPPQELFETSDIPLQEDEDLQLLMTNQNVDPESLTSIWDEGGKTVFGNWIQTKPGEIETVTFTYKLPIRLSDQTEEKSFLEMAKSRLGFKDLETHTILVQKQPGVINRTTHITVVYPDGKEVIWTSDAGDASDGSVEFTNEEDHFLRHLLENVNE